MNPHETTENYLEHIYMLQLKNGEVRSVDLARTMGYSKPTVSEQMKKLRESDYIEMAADGHITLLPQGLAIAEKILERHNVIAGILISMGVDEDVAFSDACKIEHDISEQSFRCMQAHFRRSDPRR